MRSELFAFALLLAAPAAAHNGLPVTRQILFDGDRLIIPTSGEGVYVGPEGGPFKWICEEAINSQIYRVWARAGNGTLHVTDVTGVTTSRDGGCTWIHATGDIARHETTSIVADPIDPKRAWVA